MANSTPPSPEEAATRAAWANARQIDRALCDVEEWARSILLDAGLSNNIRTKLWYSENRHRLGEPRVSKLWLAWRAMDACLLARQRLAEGEAEQALEHACDAWRYAFWPEVSARRRTIARNRDASRRAHGVPKVGERIAAYQAARTRGETIESAKRIAAEQCGVSTRTIERALEKAK